MDQPGSVDAQKAGQLLAAGLEVVEADLPVVERGVQVGQLRQDSGLVDLARAGGFVVCFGTLLGPLGSPLLLGPLAGLLVAVSLQLAEGGASA
jgi:hypothetical protein